MNIPAKLFISYSSIDCKYRDELQISLSILRRQNLISVWYDRIIEAGSQWERVLDTNLESSDIIVLLVSADFIASDYCWNKEMSRALQLHTKGLSILIPIYIRECDTTDAPFSKLQFVPDPKVPISKWLDRDEAWTSVTKAIRRVITKTGDCRSTFVTSYSHCATQSIDEEPQVCNHDLQELASILEDRAESVRKALSNHCSQTQERRQRIEFLFSEFIRLHVGHVSQLRAGQLIRAHETLREIYKILYIVDSLLDEPISYIMGPKAPDTDRTLIKKYLLGLCNSCETTLCQDRMPDQNSLRNSSLFYLTLIDLNVKRTYDRKS